MTNKGTTFTTDRATKSKSSVNNNSILSGTNPMPMKGQISDGGSSFSLMRQMYQRVPKANPLNHTSSHRGKGQSIYQDNSLYLLKKKSRAIGKQGYSSPLSFNSNPKNDVKNAQKRMRSSGAVVPPKLIK